MAKKQPEQTPLEELGLRTGDETPHELIYRAYLLGWIHFGTRLFALNRPGSPVYNAYENWGPVALILFLSAYIGVTKGWLWGLSLLAVLAFFGFALIPKYVLRKMRVRVLEKAFSSEGGWRELWRAGGLSMRLSSDPTIECIAPEGDWEAFARDNLNKPDDA